MSVKFRNPETGEIFKVESSDFCGKYIGHLCTGCPIYQNKDGGSYCVDYANKNPEEAARLMGYELVRDEENKPVEPPVALTPEHIWKEKQLNDICHAIARYVFAGLAPLLEWADEGRRLMEELGVDEDG